MLEYKIFINTEETWGICYNLRTGDCLINILSSKIIYTKFPVTREMVHTARRLNRRGIDMKVALMAAWKLQPFTREISRAIATLNILY